jgi:hypothetical protein
VKDYFFGANSITFRAEYKDKGSCTYRGSEDMIKDDLEQDGDMIIEDDINQSANLKIFLNQRSRI